MRELLNKKLYRVRVTDLAVADPFELEAFGVPISLNDKGKKRPELNNTRIVSLSIERMIGVFTSGHQIAVLNPDECVEIYNTLEDYIRTDGLEAVTSLNYVKEENTDVFLEEAEMFAESIFSLNKRGVVRDKVLAPKAFDIGFDKIIPSKPTKTTIRASDHLLDNELSTHIGNVPSFTRRVDEAEIDIDSVERTPLYNPITPINIK